MLNVNPSLLTFWHLTFPYYSSNPKNILQGKYFLFSVKMGTDLTIEYLILRHENF